MRVTQMNPFPGGKQPTYIPAPPTPPRVQKSNLFDFKSFKTDDWILLAIIAVLILEGSEDYILLCALGYLFIMGF